MASHIESQMLFLDKVFKYVSLYQHTYIFSMLAIINTRHRAYSGIDETKTVNF